MSTDAIAKLAALAGNALQLINAGTLILTRIQQRQQQRASEGREITEQDVSDLIAAGDVQEALNRAKIVQAQAAQQASGGDDPPGSEQPG